MINKSYVYLLAILLLFLIATLFYSELASSFSGTTGNYSVDSIKGSAASPPSTSANFIQRFLGGIEAVARYISNLFSGRFGILDMEVASTTTLYQCGNLTSSNTIYILNNSINSSGTCFNVLANSIVLNCNGSIINYSRSSNGYAIASNGFNHTIIQNCIIYQGSNTRTDSYALYFQNGFNSTFNNNTIYTYGSTTSNSRNHDIFLLNYRNNTASGNLLSSYGKSSYAIYLSSSANNTLSSNNISTFATGSYGIYLIGTGISGSSGNNITLNNIDIYGSIGRGIISLTNNFYNIISSNKITINGSSGYGIYLFSSSRNNNVSDNIVYMFGDSSSAVFLQSFSSNNSFIGNNLTANSVGSIGFDLASNSNQNKIINNTVRTNSYALRIANGNANFVYNNIFNSTTNNLVSITANANSVNILNTTKTATTNIIVGNNLGGNYWAKLSGTGFSQTCSDTNGDGICDTIYSINSFNKDYLPLTILDVSPPAVSLWSPVNASFVNGIVTLRANASDTSGIANVTFQYSNSSVSYTNLCIDTTSPYTCNWNTVLFSNNSEGYNIRAVAYDGQNNNANDIKHYTIDRTIPIIYDMSVIYPSGQTSIKSGQNITLSATVTDSPFVSAGIYYAQANLTNLNNSNMVNMSFFSGSLAPLQNSTWRLNVNISALTTGVTTAAISVYDATIPSHNRAGDLWQVIIDNTAPTYSSLSSSNQIYNNTLISFVVFAADTIALDHYIFSQNSSGSWINDSSVSIDGTLFYIEHNKVVYTGNFSYKFYIYDDAGNYVETSIGNIEVLGPAPTPTIYLVSPNNKIVSNNNYVNFTYYYSNSAVDNCTLNLNGDSNETVSNPLNNTVLGFSKTLADNDYSWFVSCMVNEMQGEINVTSEYFSEARSLTIDTVSPIITIVSPLNTTYNSQTIDFNITLSEFGYWCGFSLNNAQNVTMDAFNETYYSYNYPTSTHGSYSIVFNCNDSAGNYYSTSPLVFSILFPTSFVNFTFPINNAEIVRGNESSSGEDDLSTVSNFINLTGRVYNNNTDGIAGATCYFYSNGSLIGSSYTNNSGHCIYNYNKAGLSVGIKTFSVNYTLPNIYYTYSLNVSFVNNSLVRYITGLVMGNLRSNGKYYNNDSSILAISISKINDTGTYSYDPQNISANATNSGGQLRGANYYPGNISRTNLGEYSTNVTVVYGSGADSFVRWLAILSNDNFVSPIGSALHGDKDICQADFGAWSSWSACTSGSQTRSRTDSTSCTEIQTQSCGGGGGGGGGSCVPKWNSWSGWGTCLDNQEKRTRSDGCGSTETEFRQCGCISNWQCDLWGACSQGIQSKTCNDLNQCNSNNLTYSQSQSCIGTLNINYHPQELSLTLINNSIVDFSINITDSVTEPLTVKWYLNSNLEKQDSGVNSMISLYTNKFNKKSNVKSEISNGLQTQNIEWNINILFENVSCKENWYCDWSYCTNNSEFSFSSNCVDLNECGTNINKPFKRTCSCFSDFKCGDWSECSAEYNVQDILKGNYNFSGEQHRLCEDLKQCVNSTVESKICELTAPIRATKVKYCYENYIEIYEIKTNKLVSRIKEYSLDGIKKINIGFIISDFSGYCNYCYDGVKNYDEKEIDCGGQNCSVCIEKGKYFNWLYYVIIALWILLVLLIAYMIYRNRKKAVETFAKLRKQVKPEKLEKDVGLNISRIRKIELLNRFKKIVSSIRLRRAEKKRIKVERREIKRPKRKLISGEIFSRIKLPAINIHIQIGRAVGRAREKIIQRRIERQIIKPKVVKTIVVRKPEIKFVLVRFAKKLKDWKEKKYYGAAKLEEGLVERMKDNIRKISRKINVYRVRRAQIKEVRRVVKLERKIKRKEIKKQRKMVRFEKKVVRKKVREIKKKLRRKEVKRNEITDLERQLKDWKEKGYYNTVKLQRKIDEYKGKNPLNE